MKNKISLLFLLIFVGAVMCVNTGCSSQSALVGSWEATNHDWSIWVSSFPEEVQFMDDGTANLDNIASTYSIDGNTLNIKASWAALSYEYSVSGDTLTLTMDDDSVTYERAGEN